MIDIKEKLIRYSTTGFLKKLCNKYFFLCRYFGYVPIYLSCQINVQFNHYIVYIFTHRALLVVISMLTKSC